MSQDIVPTASDPARAFEDLRSEISLLRCAVEGLTAARDRVPDCGAHDSYLVCVAGLGRALPAAQLACAGVDGGPGDAHGPEDGQSQAPDAG